MHANDALVREFLLLWEQRDTDKLVAACTEDAVWHHRPLPPAVGRDGIREFAQRFADVPGGPYEILLQVADDRVVVMAEDLVITRPGPRITEGLAALARAIHPEAFTD